MLKLIVTTLSLLTATAAYAQTEMTVSSLATDSETSKAFHKMSKGHNLPDWVMKGGTSTPAMRVTVDNKAYQVVSACKPHDCAAEQIAILYSPDTKSMSAVFSKQSEEGYQQNLVWLNSGSDISIDGRTVLFAALSGSLQNHPDAFNFK
ncbi:C-lysozyme inhibitor [Enterobacter sp. UCD-UG_FMILLET]|uniref:Ivy family C-type lysozyme inhibitor n=1 Tax=Enterobacter sp. UCD-UG_FMILLET TaxID=1542468 RepID=UPI000513F874|nr:Ivy family C-type lysozyme inhibitor [Enterobacter sp. UCD-UG_FMILLET]KGI63992.1 C-lysozyme inhibitor [Enterobacter sp. UCD-UG_FMILLET]